MSRSSEKNDDLLNNLAMFGVRGNVFKASNLQFSLVIDFVPHVVSTRPRFGHEQVEKISKKFVL